MTERVTAETIAAWRTYCESKVAIKKDGLPAVDFLLVNCREFLDLLADLDDAHKRIANLTEIANLAAPFPIELTARISKLEAENARKQKLLDKCMQPEVKLIAERDTAQSDLAKAREENERLNVNSKSGYDS